MRFIKELLSLLTMSAVSLPYRAGTAVVIVFGVAGVVGVFTAISAIATSLEATLIRTGGEDRFLLLRSGSDFESASFISRDAWDAIAQLPGISLADDGSALLSAEAVVSIRLRRSEDAGIENVSARGVAPETWRVRPELRLVDGRVFQPGLREVIVGKSVQHRFPNLGIGSEIPLQGGGWRVVGVFDSLGDMRESEVMTDLDTLLSAYRRGNFSSVSGRLSSPADFETLQRALESNPDLSVQALRESEYYRRHTEGVARRLYVSSNLIASIMAIGAAFAALGAMYSSSQSRSREIGTLRAIGFQSSSVIAAVLLEALLLSLIGATLGAALAWLVFDGNVISTLALGRSDSQIMFPMTITLGVLAIGMCWAIAIGMVGGAVPAIHAGSRPISSVLKE